MIIYLQELAKKNEQKFSISLQERLPNYVSTPCELTVCASAKEEKDYFLLSLKTMGTLKIQCQRCMDWFNFDYNNQTQLAVCYDEQRAETLLEHFESLVATNMQVTLEDVVIDELYLYLLPYHNQETDCNEQINHFLRSESH